MICPECGCEYREGFTHCSDCDVDLVEPEPEEPEVDLVRVYASGNPAIVPIVESVLRDSGIEFMKTGEAVQALQGGVGSSLVVPVTFWVRAEDEATAREILDGVENAPIVEE